ncbi:DUF937 domain-containing protein [Skermania piniformis]|uniref:DUF937 domain-containing protein n=1 Tax=Skermania pinensis TaxID=39122 RepID=A0ABX8S6G4_9ACTN|nr:DUF937 domain-containing protein [Skermania piniformis]QXQ13435.1 DUF937 domain-containing protein [Skermania piniformis]
MASIEDLLSQIPVKQIADQLGVDESTASTAVRAVVPTLVGGMQANAQDSAGETSLQNAVDSHTGELLDGGVEVSQVDTADGAKIVNHVFGSQTDQVVNTLGNVGGVSSDLIKRLLPIVAPIVLSYIAKQLSASAGGAAAAPAQQPQAAGAGGGGLGDILGSILGGSSGAANAGGGALGSVLGSVLGGSNSGALGSILGGLLGGGRR